MKIISFVQPVLVQTKTGKNGQIYAMNPGERCIVNDDMAAQVMSGISNRLGPNGETISVPDTKLESVSDFDPFYKANVTRPAHFRDKRILFYRNRGIGDQLASSCLSRFFSEKLRAKCFQLSDRVHESLWVGNPYISGMPVRFPLSIDSLIRFKGRPFFDYFISMESVAEWNQEPEQNNFYDEMFVLAGLDPKNIPDDYKRPVWGVVPEDLEAFKKWKYQYGVPDDYIVLQSRATNLGRTPPLSAIDKVLESLCTIGLPVLCLDDDELTEDMVEIVSKYPNAKNLSCTTKLIRLYGTVITHAKMVVGPDSSAVHFAATNATPCIGLWGPFSPESRVKYYANHYPIYHPELCPNAPCYNFMPTLPAHKCPKGGLQLSCEVFEGVTREEVDRVVSRVVKDHKICT